MFLAALLTSMIVAGSPQGAAPPARPQEPQLEIALRTYRADDTSSGSSVSNSGAEPFSSFLTANDSLCGGGSGSKEPAVVSGFGWRVSGRVISREGDEFSVQIDWSREWERGVRAVDGPKGSSTVIMRLGDRIVLDRVRTASSTCGVVTGRLEAAMLMKTVYLKLPPGAGISGSAGASAGGRGGGGGGRSVGSGASGGGGAGAGAGATEELKQWMQNLSDRARLQLEQARGPQFEASAWLVHRQPDGTEDAQYQSIRAGAAGVPFAFAPTTFTGPNGKITVELSGRFAPTQGVGPTMRLAVNLDRHVHVDSTPPQDARGNTASTVVVAGPTDVVSFELPSPVDPKGDWTKDLLAGHQFSLRVRLTPVK